MKLELGCGQRPTAGYLHQDIHAFSVLDYYCAPWEVNLPDNSLDEVLALGVMEHLRIYDFERTVTKVHQMLKTGGIFLFDVPDFFIWSEYLYKILRGKEVPFSREHVFSTVFGWQRWEGDEHKYGWTRDELMIKLRMFTVSDGLEDIKQRAERNRFSRPEDAHIYIKAVK